MCLTATILRTPRGITFIRGALTATVPSQHQHFELLSSIPREEVVERWDEIVELCKQPMRALLRIVHKLDNNSGVIQIEEKSAGEVTGTIGSVTFDIPPAICRVIAKLYENNDTDLTPMINFLVKLMNNPQKHIIEDLFSWIQNGHMTLTEDGDFLAYKRVRADYRDIYTGSVDNSVGAKPQMPRSSVVRDRDQTCAAGLHWCSWDYLGMYGNAENSRIMIVKVNPADVDRIPRDYNHNKGVSWRYEVIGEIETERELDDVYVYNDKKGASDDGQCDNCGIVDTTKALQEVLIDDVGYMLVCSECAVELEEE